MQLLESLRSQFTDTTDQIRAIEAEVAANADALPSDEQAASLETLNEDLERIGPQIEHARARADRMSSGAELLAGVPNVDGALSGLRAVSHELHDFPTWGDYARALAAGDVTPGTIEALDRLTRDLEGAERARFTGDRALADSLSTNLAGIAPPAWLKDIVDWIGTARPAISAFDTKPLPASGMTVNFPQVTVRPLIGKQTAEKGAAASRATVIVAGSTTVDTYGGGEDVSVQAIQRTDPSYLAIVNELYAEQMAVSEDVVACTTLLAGATGTAQTMSLATAGKDIATVLAAAGKVILGARANFDTWVMGLDMWAYVVGAKDADGRPLFPNIGPANPVGTAAVNSATGSARGVLFVADPNMAAASSVAGDSRAFTTMLGGVQTLRADNPAQLGVDFAVYEFAAFALRRPSALVKITLGA